jgi:predicted nucleotidyltransferase
VKLLSGICTHLCFGAESGSADALMATAQALLSDDFPPALRAQLENGKSFPAARAAAMEAIGADASLLRNPNDILAVEYCKAILAQGSPLRILPIRREGSYHDIEADEENPSATAVRRLIESGHDWKSCIPAQAWDAFADAPVHTLAAGERAVLYRLRTMTDSEFEALPYGSEGLWRKLMHASRSCATLEDILEATKSKRYTRTRLDRMVMCAFLGITADDLTADAPYARVLAFNAAGTAVLKAARKCGLFPHTGEKTDCPYQVLEQRCDDLYGLFRTDMPAHSGKRRVYISSKTSG